MSVSKKCYLLKIKNRKEKNSVANIVFGNPVNFGEKVSKHRRNMEVVRRPNKQKTPNFKSTTHPGSHKIKD